MFMPLKYSRDWKMFKNLKDIQNFGNINEFEYIFMNLKNVSGLKNLHN